MKTVEQNKSDPVWYSIVPIYLFAFTSTKLYCLLTEELGLRKLS